MKKSNLNTFLPLGILIAVLSSCSYITPNKSSEHPSEENSSISEESSKSESQSEAESSSNSEISSSDSSSEAESSSSSSEDIVIETVEYEDVVNTEGPSEYKTYRIEPIHVDEDQFTVYNVKFNTKGYLAHPTTLTIKKSDYCLTFETVALYYQAFREVPPNYVTDKSLSGSDLRYVSSYTYGSYTGSNSYTESLGEFNNNRGTYLELDIKLNSYSLKNRGQGRVVVVVDGIKDYGDEPVCYYTNDHYSKFWEFYNYASGWGPSFKGIGSKTSPRQIPETITPIY